jgi:argininosuccinate lyase
MAYAAMFLRDMGRLTDARRRLNYSPLGSGALAGTTFPLRREEVARELGFAGVTLNSLDGVSDRDFALEFLSAAALVMMHLSRLAEEIILWSSGEFGFITLDDAYATGSSIMPQKKNPDVAELVRGKTGRVYGSLVALLTVMKGLPLAYNKDLQEDKECVFDAVDTVRKCLLVMEPLLGAMIVHKERLAAEAKKGFMNATDLADYLAKKQVPFREAHTITGRLVLLCGQRGCALEDLTLAELQAACPAFEADVYEALSVEACVRARRVPGGPAPEAVREAIQAARAELEESVSEER